MSWAKDSLHKLSCYGSITLPNIPRIAADEKSRQKYLSEYDKYEPELRRHHLGAAETTNTIGLKDVPADFDRTVPSLLGPTEAEQEYERACESRKAPALRKGYRGAGTRASHVAGADVFTPSARKFISPQPSQVARSDEEPQQRVTPSASRPSSAVSTTATSSAAPEAGEKAAPVALVEADGTRAWAAAVIEAAPAHIPRPPSALPKRKPATATPPMSQPRARTAPSLKPPLATTRLGQRSGPSSATPARVARPRPPPQERPLRATTPATALTAESTARLLLVLLNPPQKYIASLHLDLSFFDLGWLQSGQAAPHRLTTIENHFNNNEALPRFRINSPRSVITLLKNGASPKDWGPGSGAASAPAMSSLGSATKEIAAVQAEVCAHRRAYVQAQRDALRRSLQDSYSTLCACAPLNDVVNWYRRLNEADMLSDAVREEEELLPLATVVRQRQERQRRVFESSKVRMMREVQHAKELQDHESASMQRKLQAEAEAEEERSHKALEEQEARRLVQARLEAHQAERQRWEEAYRQRLQARLDRAETRKAERMSARKRQQQAMQELREARETERVRRLERKAALLEEQAVAQEQKRREKEVKCEELRAMRETRLAEEHRALAEKQQRAACLREEARQRAAEAEEAMRRAALQRQLDAEERLRGFQARRQEEAAQRAAATAVHHERLNEARSQALAKEELFKATLVEKHLQEEERYCNTRARQLADIMWRREAEWEQEEAKAYVVLQLQRIAEFKKLHTVASLLEKCKAACAVVRQRERICEQAMRAREKLRAERDALKHLISSLPQ
ncbi:hypothetical protein JIQ42_00361 [Leishmania sp. Namibia]|uniref:hypothetical protein n=1 Tax=Leishmania sp. Namibia TaxID=2802991 RepID=UPI001B637563|nr:hypothetical protein JIQ42_00361 [Leishmania sp. Namibia]